MTKKSFITIAGIAVLGVSVLAFADAGPVKEGQSPQQGQPLIKTPAEAANYTEYTQNEAVAAFL
ncbi:MAG TPA: hypothetical protein ENO03_05895, partial [Candidatus Aminicenantes bacterium]|nr:hypothetical protein [Candidatus Aminicenantes bacterium]